MSWQEFNLWGREISRRDLFKLALVGSAGLLVEACGGPSATPTPRPPTPEPTPTPEKAILWTKGILIPPELPSKRKPKAFYTQDGSIFSTNPEGYPVSRDLEGQQLWAWNERGTVWGVDRETVYVVRSDKRPYALDNRNGEPKWKYVWSPQDKSMFPTNKRSAVGETQLDWPFWLGKEKIFLSFWSDLMGSFSPRIYSYVALDRKTGDFRETREAMIMGKIGNVLLISGTLGPWFGDWIGQPKIEMTGLEINSSQPLWTNNYREGWVMEKYYYYDSLPQLLAVYAPDPRSFAKIPGQLIAIDPQTGKYLWAWDNLQTKAGKGDNQLAGQAQGMVFIADKNRGITYCVKASDGNLFWGNDDLLLDQVVGISQNTLVATRKGPDILYGLNPKNGRRLWYWELNKLTAPPMIHQDKIVYGSGPYLLVLDAETGKNTRNAPITLREGETTRLVSHQDLLFVQTGKPGGRGTLSAVKI